MRIAEKEYNVENALKQRLGVKGKMLSFSKSTYSYDNPRNLVVFNSNLFIKTNGKYQKIWHGDLDVTKSFKDLLFIHKRLGKNLYVLYEMDGRFDKEKNPNIKNAVLSFIKDKETTILYNKEYFYTKDGTIFQSSHDFGKAITFPLNGVIAGWTQGVPGMKVGGTRRLIIPAAMAYGASSPAPNIPANSDLVFDIELVELSKNRD